MTSKLNQSENLKTTLANLRSDENWKYTSLSKLSSFEPCFNLAPLNEAELQKVLKLKTEVLERLGIEQSRSELQWNILVLADAKVLEEFCRFRKDEAEVSVVPSENRPDIQNEYAGLSELSPSARTCKVRLKKNTADAQLAAPIKFLILDACGIQAANNTSNFFFDIEADKGAEADIVFVSLNSSQAPSLSTQNISLKLKANSCAKFLLVQETCLDSVHLSQICSSVYANSRLNLLSVSRSNGLIRNDLAINLEEAGAEADFRSFYSPHQSGHIDNHTVVRHVKNNTKSSQLYKGLVFDKARAVFNGKVIIDKGADGSSAGQLNRTILMGDGARVDTKPELQILADEVSCSHGASVGPLSEDEIFYLQSRCLTREQAVSLIGEGFVAELAQCDAFKASHFQKAFESWTRHSKTK